MQDMSIRGPAQAVPRQERVRDQRPETEAETVAAAELAADAGEGSSLSFLLSQGRDEGQNLAEMIRGAQEKAAAQREAMKLPKNSVRYGDAPLEAYARLARAKSRQEVAAASGYARRRLAQFKTALRADSDNSAKIKAAISQLQKAVNRGEKKKRELDREQLTESRRRRAAREDLREKERRLRQELCRRRSQRMVRESGYLREAEISGRLAAQLTAAQLELRQQARELAAATSATLESAVRQYAAAETAPAEGGFQGEG